MLLDVVKKRVGDVHSGEELGILVVRKGRVRVGSAANCGSI